MTAKTEDGREIYSWSRVYMPVPQQFGRGDRMGRGPYEKSGLVEDTGLPAGEPVTERFDIPVPDGIAKELAGSGKPVEFTATLWYLPFGTRDASAVAWKDESIKVPIAAGLPETPR